VTEFFSEVEVRHVRNWAYYSQDLKALNRSTGCNNPAVGKASSRRLCFRGGGRRPFTSVLGTHLRPKGNAGSHKHRSQAIRPLAIRWKCCFQATFSLCPMGRGPTDNNSRSPLLNHHPKYVGCRSQARLLFHLSTPPPALVVLPSTRRVSSATTTHPPLPETHSKNASPQAAPQGTRSPWRSNPLMGSRSRTYCGVPSGAGHPPCFDTRARTVGCRCRKPASLW